MASPVVTVSQHLPEFQFITPSSESWQGLLQERLQQIQAVALARPRPTILVAELEPSRFLAGIIAARHFHCPLVLGNPHWVEADWQQVLTLTQPDLIWGAGPCPPPSWLPPPTGRSPHPLQPGWILIPTGGSSGHLRFAIHTWDRLVASATGFQQYFHCDRIHSCCVLPLYHVSGLMQWVRSLVSGGMFALWPYKALEAHQFPDIDPSQFFLSLVPTQLQRLLAEPPGQTWLRQVHTLLLGGAPPWPALLESARQHGIRLALTYGMTETASQVVALHPDAFLQGHRHVGSVLPHAQVTVGDRPDHPHPPNQVGLIHIRARSLCLGYYPSPGGDEAGWTDGVFTTDDLGYVDPQGHLHIVGRQSHKIITGGENVYPAEVEAAIRATGLVQDVCVVGVPHADWGEAIAALYVPWQTTLTAVDLQQAIAPLLSRFKHPKYWLAQPCLPRNAQGKMNWLQMREAIARSLPPSSPPIP